MALFIRSFSLVVAFLLGVGTVILLGRAVPGARSLLLRAVGEGGGTMAGMHGEMAPPSPGGGAGAAAEKRVLYWKSSMSPGEIYKAPGKDSMGMDLVPVYEGEEGSAREIKIDPVTQQNTGVRIGKVRKGPLEKTVRVVAYVAYDETTLANVNLKVGGWIEKLHVDKTGQQIHRGDPLFEIYSPELYSAQEEYLSALKGLQQPAPESPLSRVPADTRALLESTRTRLRLYDVSEDQVADIEKSRTVTKTLLIDAPVTGIVILKGVVTGQYVKAGENIFRIADVSNVWVLGRVYEQDLPFVKEGQEARMTLDYLPGRTYLGKVTYVYPYLETGTREVSVRMEFPNPGYVLKPGMYTTAEIRSLVENEAVLVPSEAVIRTGARDVAFVAVGDGKFETRRVRLGLVGAGSEVQILEGLEPGEDIVLSGQFLIDSESRLREAALKMLEPEKNAAAQTGAARPEAPPPAGAGAESSTALKNPGKFWVCPMPEHASILYDAQGNCPICKSMRLVPAPQER